MSPVSVRLLLILAAVSVGGLGFDVAPQELGPPAVLAALPSSDIDRSFVRPLPFLYDLYTFRGEGGLTTVVAAFAVEAGELEKKRVGDNDRYRFSVTLLLADTRLHTVTNRHDSVFVDLPRRMRDEHLLYTHIEVQAVPSRDIRQIVYMQDATEAGIGQGYPEYIQIPDYSGSELMLSDVALGQPGGQFGWGRGEAILALLPTRQFPSREFDVYYEIYNLPTGNPYSTEITIERITGNPGETPEDRDPIRLRFASESTASEDGMMPELRRVGTAFPKGSYRMTVTIEDLTTGETASRSNTFEVQNSGRGATMVPALPVAPLKRGN